MLCTVCASMLQDGSLDFWRQSYHVDDRRSVILPTKPHHKNASDLQQAALDGCYICLRLSKVMSADGTVYKIRASNRDPKSWALIFEPCLPGGQRGHHMFRFHMYEPSVDMLEMSDASLRQVWTGSLQCLDLARYWLKDCLKKHSACGSKRDPSWYPTRLLRLEGSVAKLITTSLHDLYSAPYATASHCWGDRPIDVLTPETKDDLEIGRPLKDFPRSFRDFFEVAKHLGIDLVWIDSFCILQGSSDESVQDWQTESRLMENVYSNSILNIAATASVDSAGGCFQTRQETAKSSRPHRFTWRPFAGEPPHTFTISDLPSDPLNMFNAQHLFTRAWVVQERLLCPRMLHFGQDQLWWQCADEPLLCESYPTQSPLNLSCPSVKSVRPAALDTTGPELYGIWDGIMNIYTNSALSHPDKDKSLAIQGIASRIQTTTEDTYTFGIFWSQLPQALGWMRSEFATPTTPTKSPRAPTWSWASTNGSLFFGDPTTPPTTRLPMMTCLSLPTPGILTTIGKPLRIPLESQTPSSLTLTYSLCGGTSTAILDSEEDRTHTPSDRLFFLPIFLERQELYDGAGIEEFPTGLVLIYVGGAMYRRLGLSYSSGYDVDEFKREYARTKARIVMLV